MIKVAPSILSADFSRLAEEVKKVEIAGADLIHIDVMDGHFVPNLTVGPVVVQWLRKITPLPLDVHLMIEEPERYVEDFARAGANWLSVHIEACREPRPLLQKIRSLGIHPVIVLKPETALASILSVLADVDMVLVMTVSPGFGGQVFRPEVLPKIAELAQTIQAKGLPIAIEVDGGINVETAPSVVKAGATVLVAGSAIYHAKDPASVITQLKNA